MARVNLPPVVTFSWVDETGSTSSTQVSVPAATTVADARTAAENLAVNMQAITGCILTGYSIAFSTTETTPGLAAPESRVERKGNFVFRTAAGKLARVTVPGVDPAVVLPSGRIDEDVQVVADFIAALLAAPWVDSNGSDLSALAEAYESFRSSTKGQLPRDRRPDNV